MERSEDESSSPVTSLCHHHHRHPSSAEVIAPGHQQVTCSGDGEEMVSGTCRVCSRSECADGPRGPIRCCSDVRETSDGQGAGLSLRDDVTQSDRISPNVDMTCRSACSDSVESCTEGSKVNCCHRLDGDGCCGGGATRGTTCHLDEPTSSEPPSRASEVDMNPVTPASDSDSDTQEADLTSDLPEVNYDDDDAFITEPPPPGELNLPTAAAGSRNTFKCGRRLSAPGQLVQDEGGSESELQSRRPGIAEYFSR